MAVSVQKFREVVFQLLYCRSFEGCDLEAIIPMLMKQHAISRKSVREMVGAATQIWEGAEQYDQLIARYCQNFALEKIGRVERALLQQAIASLHFGRLPPKVVISEAIRLSKKFATPESGAFVNALLDAIYKEKKDAPIPEESAII